MCYLIKFTNGKYDLICDVISVEMNFCHDITFHTEINDGMYSYIIKDVLSFKSITKDEYARLSNNI